LPLQVTSFVGRATDVTAVSDALAQSRLVTLTGVGGVGKTRLALQVAAEVVPQYAAGAWLVELAAVRDPEAVPEVLVAMFGLAPSGGYPPTKTLVEFLRGKELLMVLDNCEHLLRAVARLVDEVVRGCPGLRVLATSREPLNVAGERLLGVASLDVPPQGASFDAIVQCDAVVLFVERARAVKSSFALDTTNADAVAQVCRRLDGIALAIELAAARVAMLTPAEVALRLDRRFRLLAGGQRTAVERHQTLRAAIDWSYELLSEPEQLLLARLSVFASGFSLGAAEAVTGGAGIDSDDVFELLATLLARSLVAADTEGTDTRYRLLETIRQYAQEHLDNGGDGDRLRTGHAAYFASFAEMAIAKAVGPDGVEWEHRLRRESDNLRAALTWATDTGDVDTALRLVAMWHGPVQMTDASLSSTAVWACDTLAAFPGASEHPKYPAALAVAAFIAWAQSDQELATRRCDEALAAERRLGTEPSAGIWMVRCSIAYARGEPREAVEYAGQAVALARARGEPAHLAGALSSLALAHTLSGDPDGAVPAAEEVVALVHRLANPRLAHGPLALAAFALGSSEPRRALALAREAVELTAPGEANIALAIAGELAARYGDRQEALAYMARAIDTFYWLGGRLALGTIIGSAALLLDEGDPEAAAVLLGVGDAMAPGFTHDRRRVEAAERAIETLDASIGHGRRLELYDHGKAMDDADAVACARAAIARSLGVDQPEQFDIHEGAEGQEHSASADPGRPGTS
jgi:predicted ATPase